MNIRLMTMADYPAAYALWLRTPGMGLKDLDDGPEGTGRFLGFITSSIARAQVLIVLKEGPNL